MTFSRIVILWMTSTIISLSYMNMIRCSCHNSFHLTRIYTMMYVSFQLMCLLWWRRGILTKKALNSDYSSISLLSLMLMYTWIWCRCVRIRCISVQFRRNVYHHLRFDAVIDVNRHVILSVVEKVWRKSKRFRRKDLPSDITQA